MINFNDYTDILETELVTIHDLVGHVDKSLMDFDKHGNVFINFNEETKGYPILVSHMDNVLHGERIPMFDLTGRFLMGKEAGIGFDDKAGIIACLELFNRLNGKVRLVFTTDEEIGGISAGKIDPSKIKDAPYMIELDRKGGHDIIQHSGVTRLCDDEFALMWENVGFKRATGTFTDVNKFKGKLPKIQMCNLSIGYYKPHSDGEYLDTVEFNNIVDRVEAFVSEHRTMHPDETKDAPVSNYAGYHGHYGTYEPEQYPERSVCCNCGAEFPPEKAVMSKLQYECCSQECAKELDEYDNM